VRTLCFIFIATLFSVAGFAQDEDYYKEEEERVPITAPDLENLYRWGPKFGIEVHSAINYNHILMPPSIAGFFSKAIGGVGFDGGAGIRIRAYHKLAFATGFNYTIRQFNLKYEGEEIGTGNLLDVSEKASMHYVGFYFKTLIEISKKFHLAQTFQYAWLYRYNGTASAVNQANGNVYPNQPTTEPSPPDWTTSNQAELGVELAYKWKVAPQLILKPYVAISFGLTPVFHTNAYLAGIFGQEEQNPRYANLKIGIIFETGLWLDEPKR